MLAFFHLACVLLLMSSAWSILLHAGLLWLALRVLWAAQKMSASASSQGTSASASRPKAAELWSCG